LVAAVIHHPLLAHTVVVLLQARRGDRDTSGFG
jgi:hypothetical protein